MKEEELLACLRLQAVPNVGVITSKKLIARFGRPSLIFSEGLRELRKMRGIGPVIAASLGRKEYAEQAERELQYIRRKDVNYWYYGDAAYPKLLKHCPDGPILLFYQGNLQLSGKPLLSVVGTRKMTPYGRDFCRGFIRDLAPLDPVLISGLAYGVDICVHEEAIKQGLQTIAVLAHGLRSTYPSEHWKYRKALMRNGGLITEFWSGSRPEREHFLRRNRIIAGLSEATVVIESAEKGGGLVTADLALGYHRDVFALPGRVSDPMSKGCNSLIAGNQAQLLTDAGELARAMNWSSEPNPAPVQTRLFGELDTTETRLMKSLPQGEKVALDTLALASGYSISKTAALLFQLELKGLVRPLPGKCFERVV